MSDTDAGRGTRVTVTGPHHTADQNALATLCAAVEQAVQAHRPAGFTIREVVVMVEEGGSEAGAAEPAPVYVDVYDSGYLQDSGYGHGI